MHNKCMGLYGNLSLNFKEVRHFCGTRRKYAVFFSYFSFDLCTSQFEASTSPPPGQSPGHLNFWKIFVQIPPSPGRKAVQMPPPLGKFPDYCFNFSVASVMFPKLCMLTWFIRQHIFIYYRYKSFLNTFKYGTKLV